MGWVDRMFSCERMRV